MPEPELLQDEQENKDFIAWLESHPTPMAMLLKGLQLVGELDEHAESGGGKAWATRRRADPRCSTPSGSGARFTPERIAAYRTESSGGIGLDANDVDDILDEVEYCHHNLDSLAIGLKLAAIGKEVDRQRIKQLESTGDGALTNLLRDLGLGSERGGKDEILSKLLAGDDDETLCDCEECCQNDKEDDDN